MGLLQFTSRQGFWIILLLFPRLRLLILTIAELLREEMGHHLYFSKYFHMVSSMATMLVVLYSGARGPLQLQT